MGTAWRRALTHTVTVRRNTTAKSASGATKFVYADVLTGVPCTLQDAGGRLRQDDQGQKGLRKKSALFGEEMMGGVLLQNDLVVDAASGLTYRLTHVHDVVDFNAPHVECVAEQWIPGGRD